MKKNMRLAMLTATLALTANVAMAQTLAGGQIKVENAKVKKLGNTVAVSMDLNLDALGLSANEGIVLTPMLINGTDTARFSAAEILGRKRYIYYQRNDGKTASDNPALVARRKNNTRQTESYAAQVSYQAWMRGSQLSVGQGLCGCDQALIGQGLLEPAGQGLYGAPKMDYAYAKPAVEGIKHRAESGTARLSFVVDKYDIREDFGSNATELAKIRQTVDLVKNDKDVTLTGIKLHGYASPDGEYSHNATLAKNRTNALRNYLKSRYTLSASLYTVNSTAEDWDGVRAYLEKSSLKHKDDLLAIVNDGKLTPDEKDRTIARKYGELYKGTFLKDIYPPLRRTDYEVTYNVRSFNLEEARRIIRERPQKLSLNEMYMVAGSYAEGCDDFNQVFDVAVRMFPEDKVANLNAALVSMQRGDSISAAKFLEKAGDSAEADNARGILAVKAEKYAEAKSYFEKAARAGLKAAQANLERLKD